MERFVVRTVVKHRSVCQITVGCIFVTICVLAKDSNKSDEKYNKSNENTRLTNDCQVVILI